jgi:uncharacterized protein (TIGR03437 family)
VNGQTQLFAFTHGRGAWRVATNTTGCAYSLSSPGQTFPNAEMTGTVNVTAAPAACAWTAVSNADWITVTGGASGAGDGAVTFSIASNTTNSVRVGTVSIAGRSFNIVQQGCQYTLSQSSRVMEAAAGTGTVGVTVEGTGCSWIASSNANWITIQVTPGGVNYTVAANAGLFARTGTISLAGQTFTIFQAGTGGACTATPITLGQPRNGALAQGDCLSPLRGGNRFADRYSFSGTAGQQVVLSQSSTAFDSYLYLIGPNGALLAQDDDGGDGVNSRIPPDSGFFTLPATGTYLLEATSLGENRAGDYTISVTSACNYAISPTTQAFTPAGGTGSVNVTAASGCPWISESESSWLSVTSGASGSGNGTVNFSVAPNTATTSSRTGTLKIADQTFTVTQTGCSYSLAPASQSVGAAGGAGSIAVTTTSGCAWVATTLESWIAITSGAGGNGNGTVNFTVAANPNPAPRMGTINAAGIAFAVTQTAGNSAPTIASLNPNSVLAGSGAFTLTVTGSNFINGAVVRWNNSDRATTFVSSTQLTAAIPAGDIATAGSATIAVAMPAPDNRVSTPLSLTIREPNKTPQLTGLAPNPVVAGGPAFTLSVNGRDFVSGSTVRWDGNNRPTSFVSATQLTAAIPAADIAAARDVKITVFTPDGGGVSNETVLAIANPVANVPAASFSGMTIAPDSIVAAFGTKLATATRIATTTPLPTELEGTTVRVRDSAGAERLARLFFVSPTQINYLMPAETVAGPATVTVRGGDGSLSVGSVQIAPAQPTLFTANASGQGVLAGVALRVKADGTQVYEAVARFDPAQSRFVATPIDLGPENEQVYLIPYGSGIRYRSSLSAVMLTIGGINQSVLYAGPVEGLVGLDQLNIGPLTRTLIGRGEVDVVLTVDGKPANTVRVAIK